MDVEKSNFSIFFVSKVLPYLFPPKVELYVGLRCNFRCPYCYLSENFLNKKMKEISISEILNFLVYHKIKEVEILGGEPFLYKQKLIKFLSEIKKHKISIAGISTNGSIFDKELASFLIKVKIKKFQVSLDSPFLQTFEKLRANNYFRKIMENVRNFQKEGLDVTLSMTVNRENFFQIKDFIEFGLKNGIRNFHFGYFVPVGRGRKLKNLMLSQHQFEILRRKVQKYRNNYQKKGVRISFYDPTISADFCSAVFQHISILPNGDIYPCGLLINYKKFKLGNISKFNHFPYEKINKLIEFELKNIRSNIYYKRCLAAYLSIYEQTH